MAVAAGRTLVLHGLVMTAAIVVELDLLSDEQDLLHGDDLLHDVDSGRDESFS